VAHFKKSWNFLKETEGNSEKTHDNRPPGGNPKTGPFEYESAVTFCIKSYGGGMIYE
jgi:hypothetical protein